MRVWWRFLVLFLPYRGRLVVTFLATLARPLLNAGKIYLLKLVVDNLVRNPTGTVALVICGGYLIIALLKGIANFGDQYLGTFVGGRIIIDLRQQVYARFLRLSLRYHGQHGAGESLSRLIGDVGAVENMLVAGLTDGATQVLTVLVFAGMLFYLDPHLAGLSLTVVPVLFIALVVYGRRSRAALQEVRVRLAELTSTAEEAFSNIGLVKSFMRHDHECARLESKGEAHWNVRLRAARQRAFFVPVSDIVATCGTVLVVYFGARALATHTLSIGGLVVFLAYLGQLYTPLMSLSRLGNSLQSGVAAAERVAAILDLPEDDDEPHAATHPWGQASAQYGGGVGAPAIVFDRVAFAYTPERQALRGFSLTVPRGAMVALVGASGAGKSTAVALLQRLYEPDAGEIRLFGHDIREADTETLWSQLAVVPQEVSLLMGSIYDNIAYGDLSADAATIRAAAWDAGIQEMRLVAGLDTQVGPRGAKLSGGQRQRVAIARALVRRAPILILDEATSALDALSEERLRTLLGKLRPQSTILLVAHRLSTVRAADLIAVVDNGRVVEFGTHDGLLARGGAYAALVRAQVTTGKRPLPVSTPPVNTPSTHLESAPQRATPHATFAPAFPAHPAHRPFHRPLMHPPYDAGVERKLPHRP